VVGFANNGALVDAETAGRLNRFSFRKVPAVVTAQGTWYDYSMSPGNPAPQYYAAAPLTAQTMTRSGDGGLYHGLDVSPATKYLRKLMLMCVTAGGVPQQFTLLDYLMFYPFVDMGTADPQTLTNVQTLLRYTDGDGVKIMAILVAPQSLAMQRRKVSPSQKFQTSKEYKERVSRERSKTLNTLQVIRNL
jgi:hypothetical protein